MNKQDHDIVAAALEAPREQQVELQLDLTQVAIEAKTGRRSRRAG